jgi:WD40 repeat protein
VLTFFFWLASASLLGSDRQGATCVVASGDAVAVGGQGGVDLYIDHKRTPLGEKRNVFGLHFSGDKLLESGGRAGERGRVLCWEWRSGKLLWATDVEDDIAYSVAAARTKVFCGGSDKSIAVLDLDSGKRLKYLLGHAGAVLTLAVSPDGKTLASGGTDRSVRIWSTADDTLLRAINNHGDTVHALAWSPDGKYLASGSADRTVRIWQPEIGRLVRIVRGHEAPVLSLAFREGEIISGSADGKVRIIDASSDAIVKVLEGHKDWVTGISLSKEGFVSADWRGKVLAWKGSVAGEIESGN